MKYITIAAVLVLSTPVIGGVAAETRTAGEIPDVPCAADTIEQTREVATVTVIANGREFVYRDEFITPSDFTVAEQIELRKINASAREKNEYVDMCLGKGADYKAALGECYPLLIRFVDGIADYLYVPPENATVKPSGNGLHITREKSGRALDERKLYAGLYYSLRFSDETAITADTITLQPEITYDDIKNNFSERGRYGTSFVTSTDARAHNVSLALEKINGAEIGVGETFSFNLAVGARTAKNGFKSAKIIVNGEYTDGVGGGVCQASTALYNAALSAGLHCNANAHSICPSYCPPGTDAMISSCSDLKITNTTSHPVYILATSENKRGTVVIYGEKNEFDIVAESVVIRKISHPTREITDNAHNYFDESAESGDRRLVTTGKDGYESETYLKYIKDGAIVKRVKIRTDVYKTVESIVAVAP